MHENKGMDGCIWNMEECTGAEVDGFIVGWVGWICRTSGWGLDLFARLASTYPTYAASVGCPPVRPVLQIRLEGALMLHISGLHLVRPLCVPSRVALLC